MKVAMMDINGTLEQDLKSDALKFGIVIEPIPAMDLMGFQVFEISGKRVKDFLDHYELEALPD